MARYTEAVCRICRREGDKLFLKGDRCYTDKCAIARRSYAPGQHGQGRKKLSEYGTQMREKQKLKEMNANELRMSQEIDAGKLQVEGKQYTIMYQEMGKAGVYDEKGNRISWRYMGVNEFQMNVAIEAERADINMEDVHEVEVDLHAGQSMDLGEMEQGLTTEDLTL